MTGADIDLTKLPVHLQHGKDGGPFISAAMDFARDPATGWTNVGLRRLMLRGRATTGIDLVAPSDLRKIYLAALKRGERLPLSVVVGGHPIDYFGATMRMPVDELGLLASLRGGADAGGQEHHQRHPRPGRRRMGARRLSRRGRLPASRKDPTASSLATTAASRPIRCSTSPPSRAGATRCSRP